MYTDDPISKKKTRMDIAGKRFGHLTVIGYAFTNNHNKSMWHCRCDCGKKIIVSGSHLVNGHTKSCGCFRVAASGDRVRKHGMKHTRLYRIWQGMKSRCTIESVPCFDSYGGRGITVCDEWSNSFEAFHDWAMSHGYSGNLTIDRIDVNGNYCPENCRWITQKEQCNNTRVNRTMTFNGEAHTLKEWSEITGINYRTMYSRYLRGKSPEEILRKVGVTK